GPGRILRMSPKTPFVCTTTTTTLGGSTTTTTLDPCAALAGAEQVACQLDAASKTPLCPGMDATLADAIQRRFEVASTLVPPSAPSGPRLAKSLRLRADHRLRALLPKLRHAAHKGILDAGCRSAIEARIAAMRAAIQDLRPQLRLGRGEYAAVVVRATA